MFKLVYRFKLQRGLHMLSIWKTYSTLNAIKRELEYFWESARTRMCNVFEVCTHRISYGNLQNISSRLFLYMFYLF